MTSKCPNAQTRDHPNGLYRDPEKQGVATQKKKLRFSKILLKISWSHFEEKKECYMKNDRFFIATSFFTATFLTPLEICINWTQQNELKNIKYMLKTLIFNTTL